MKPFLSLFLVMSLFCAVILFTVSCAPEKETPPEDPTPTPGGDSTSDDSKIYAPPFKLYEDRRAVKLSAVSYRSPDTDALFTALDDTAALLIANTVSDDEQVQAVKAISAPFSEIITMGAYLTLKIESGADDAEIRDEYARLCEARPRLIQKIETLCVAAANSPHADRFSSECFSEDLTSYRDGGRYTDEAVEAMTREAKKENEFLFLSDSDFTVTYEGETDTAGNLIARYRETYGEGTKEFIAVKATITALARTQKNAREKALYAELVALRREIADALGASSYAEVAYGALSYSYTEREMSSLLSDVADNAVDVYRRLYNDVFLSRGDTTAASQKIHKTINRLSSLYGDRGGILRDAYNFMLQYSLYDIAPEDDTRADGGKVFYLDAYDSPVLFLSAKENVTDYLSLSRAFGEYLSAYRFGTGGSAELSAFHAYACELLTLRLLDGQVTDETYTTLLYSAMEDSLLDLINYAFAAAVEAEIYALPADRISVESIDSVVTLTAERFGLSESINSISYLMCDELVCSPFSMQAHVTAILPALELFFEEAETPSLGVEKYLSLLGEESRADDLSSVLSAAELQSPFASGRVRTIACNIFYELYGANYSETKNMNLSDAA